MTAGYLPATGEKFRVVLDRTTGKRAHTINTTNHVCVGRTDDGHVLAKYLDHKGQPNSRTFSWDPARYEFEQEDPQ